MKGSGNGEIHSGAARGVPPAQQRAAAGSGPLETVTVVGKLDQARSGIDTQLCLPIRRFATIPALLDRLGAPEDEAHRIRSLAELPRLVLY